MLPCALRLYPLVLRLRACHSDTGGPSHCPHTRRPASLCPLLRATSNSATLDTHSSRLRQSSFLPAQAVAQSRRRDFRRATEYRGNRTAACDDRSDRYRRSPPHATDSPGRADSSAKASLADSRAAEARPLPQRDSCRPRPCPPSAASSSPASWWPAWLAPALRTTSCQFPTRRDNPSPSRRTHQRYTDVREPSSIRRMPKQAATLSSP